MADFKFHVHSKGNISPETAVITLSNQPGNVEDVRLALTGAFEEIFGDDVTVYTEAELQTIDAAFAGTEDAKVVDKALTALEEAHDKRCESEHDHHAIEHCRCDTAETYDTIRYSGKLTREQAMEIDRGSGAYSDQDDVTQMYCVWGAKSGFCYSQHSDIGEATEAGCDLHQQLTTE